MANAKIQTVETGKSVKKFLEALPDKVKQADSVKLVNMMREVSGFEPKMWGPAIIGFGSFHYTYESGREGDMPLVGFSPRKDTISLYLETKFENRDELLKKFGKHTTSKVCIYVKRLDDIDMGVLRKMIAQSVKYTKKK